MEARSQRKSWRHMEKARVIHDVCLLVMAATMLIWALRSWQAGALTPGDVVLISTLSFRILHGSRDLGLALVGTTQEFGVISEMLSVLAEQHALPDKPCVLPHPPRSYNIQNTNVRYAHPGGRPVLDDFNLFIPEG